MSPTRPNPPFHRWPVQAFDARFGFAWWTSPAAVVMQSTIPRGTLEAAKVVQSYMDDVLTRRADAIAEAGGLLVFHDWRATTGYDTDARKYYLERMRARPKGYLRHSVVAIDAHPLFRMAVEAGNLVAAMTARAKVEIAKDPGSILERERLGVPASPQESPFGRVR